MPIDGIPDEYENLFFQQAGGTFNPALGNMIAQNPHAFAMHLASQGVPPPPDVGESGGGADEVSYPPQRSELPTGDAVPVPRPAPGAPPTIPAPPDGTQGPSTADLRGVSKDIMTSGPPSGTTPGGMVRPGSLLDKAYSWAFGPSTAAAADLGGPVVRGPEPRVPDYPMSPPRATRSPGTDIGAPLVGQIDPRSIPPPATPAADASKTSRQDATTMSPFAGIVAPRPPEVQKVSSPSAHAPVAINAQNLAELLKLLQGASAPAPNVLRLNPAIAGR